MNPPSRITVHPDAVFTRLGPESATVLNLSTKRYYSLNGTGLRIWELIERDGASQVIARTLCEEYEIEIEAALGRVDAFVDELRSEGLVETR